MEVSFGTSISLLYLYSMILWTTILDKLKLDIDPTDDLRFIDIRYLDKWLRKYSQCFPKYMLSGNADIKFNGLLLRWEIKKQKI